MEKGPSRRRSGTNVPLTPKEAEKPQKQAIKAKGPKAAAGKGSPKEAQGQKAGKESRSAPQSQARPSDFPLGLKRGKQRRAQKRGDSQKKRKTEGLPFLQAQKKPHRQGCARPRNPRKDRQSLGKTDEKGFSWGEGFPPRPPQKCGKKKKASRHQKKGGRKPHRGKNALEPPAHEHGQREKGQKAQKQKAQIPPGFLP